ALGVEMLLLAGVERDAAAARRCLEETVRSGRALETFGKVIEAQGGDPAVIEDPGILPQADAVEVFRAPLGGTVGAVDPRIIGRAIIELGGGRQTMADPVDPTVGFVITVKPGDRVKAGQPLASVFARDDGGIAAGLDALRRAIVIGEAAHPLPLVSHRVTATGVEAF
ncbi:MAG TPA: thymidine phosphorylase, partial [Gemmatimonadales bacterium]|nr:thymidine phosphorylase [Gemmatimonadales bacterium]